MEIGYQEDNQQAFVVVPSGAFVVGPFASVVVGIGFALGHSPFAVGIVEVVFDTVEDFGLEDIQRGLVAKKF